ncbi:MAG TPA: thioredoxin family protein [Candidatus Limnocylindria bacterium]|nr:thioredoxin family protein [Candidatus Limnocylindria bacterium]
MIRQAPRLEAREPAQLKIGERTPGFEGLLGTDGHRYGLNDFAHSRLVVVIFASNRCPTVHAYEERLRAFQEAYGPRGVQVVAINSNDEHLYPEESYERMVAFARDSGYSFPYLKDSGQEMARAWGPTRTFEVFVLDQYRRLRYHGRFDDARLADRVTTHDLRDAVEALLVRRDVQVPSTRPFGCSLDLV